MDFTGGTHMYYTLNTAPADLWEIMECAFKSKTLMGCGSKTGVRKTLPNPSHIFVTSFQRQNVK